MATIPFDSYKRRPDFAEMQIRTLLKELDTKPHKDRLRALRKFEEYAESYKPEVIFTIFQYLKLTYFKFNFCSIYLMSKLLHFYMPDL